MRDFFCDHCNREIGGIMVVVHRNALSKKFCSSGCSTLFLAGCDPKNDPRQRELKQELDRLVLEQQRARDIS